MSFIEQLSDAQLALAQGLGIDVYRLRHGRPSERVPTVAATSQLMNSNAALGTASSSGASKVPSARDELAAMRAALGVESAAASATAKPSSANQPKQPEPLGSTDSVAVGADDVLRCELIAWRCGKTFLVCSDEMLNDDSQRLIKDLLKGLDPGRRVTRMKFSWPAAGGGPSDAQSAAKAWRALWQRRTDGAELLLATADPLLEQWLSDVAGVHWLPALDSLVGNGEGKRALWQALVEHQSLG